MKYGNNQNDKLSFQLISILERSDYYSYTVYDMFYYIFEKNLANNWSIVTEFNFR